jgi:serine/threonine protein kinase
MILAGSTFHTKNLKIGDVRPENIFISPEGQVRIATQFTWPG